MHIRLNGVSIPNTVGDMNDTKRLDASGAVVRSDLTGYAGLVGETFAARIDLLGTVLQGAHHPSTGRYKERLLINTIRDFLPRSVEVGTVFVLFPHEDSDPPAGGKHHDPLNQCAFTVSRQCDVLVFDSYSYPPVFRDGDFVVVRPESVRAVIEVKGSLTIKETKSVLESFEDFGRKWRNTQLFYQSHGQALTASPALFVMAWKIKERGAGRPETTPRRIREFIATYYAEKVSLDELNGFPLLNKLLIYAESEIAAVFHMEEGTLRTHFGWHSSDGRFTRLDQRGGTYRGRDRTIASLLAALHWAVSRKEFNKFFAYYDEVKDRRVLPYPDYGISHAWKDIGGSKGHPFNPPTVA